MPARPSAELVGQWPFLSVHRLADAYERGEAVPAVALVVAALPDDAVPQPRP
ncbi:hypothetical protein ABT160_27080 [Streptomyces sp. NPDC001941]|uniref:hypothetical protein n=1 Tax=Streptomyces sp. NPDC001941 TaxID=3154659 RepID=UPI00331838CF